MKTPAWWSNHHDPRARLLVPVSWVYRAGAKARAKAAVRPYDCPVPVFCVGNACAGGAGKTPLVRFLAERLYEAGVRCAAVTRGYGGSLRGPVCVEPDRHLACDTGDEALLLARDMPVVAGRDRPRALDAACAADPDVILADDGMQNPLFVKDAVFLAENPEYEPANARLFPAGPWRMPPSEARAQADARFLMYYREPPPEDALKEEGGKPVFRVTFVLETEALDLNFPYLAFAGIGNPAKFFDSARAAGVRVTETVAFPDHHPFTSADESGLLARAEALDAMLLTTEKDYVRLSPFLRARCRVLPGALRAAPAELARLDAFLAQARARAMERRMRPRSFVAPKA